MCARVQGGIYGPALEKHLKLRGLTLRHFPQSFEFSTLGGWLATRGGGHFATGPTHVDDMVESVRLVTPAGTTESRRLPGSGAGPAEYRLYLGSEGILGIITEAWVRVLPLPRCRASTAMLFRAATDDEAFVRGARAVKQVAQSGLRPSNLRLVYGQEAATMTKEKNLEASALLLLGFEAAEASSGPGLEQAMGQAVDLCEALGGEVTGGRPKTFVRQGGGGERDGLQGKWGSGFMRGGYTFSAGAASGLVLNTFETAVTWDRFFGGFHAAVLAATRAAVQRVCGGGVVTCRFTHVYPDGPAPYYTVMAPGALEPTDRRPEQWLEVKKAAMEAVMCHGGTSTHHHSVGKLHRSSYHEELGSLYKATLASVKSVHDPAWILNPGVLLERRAKL